MYSLKQDISFFQPNITGLILAGSADFKTELSQSDMFDQVSCLNRGCATCKIEQTAVPHVYYSPNMHGFMLSQLI